MSYPWYYPKISRLRAEELLLDSGKNGAFIIRESENIPNVLVLCLLLDRKIHHYRIWRDSTNGNFFMEAVHGVTRKNFAKLEDLVTFYSQRNQGLACDLSQPVVPSYENALADDDTDDEDDDIDEMDSKPAENEYDYPPVFKSNAERLDSERIDNGFQTALGLYLGDGLGCDMQTARDGGTVLEGMQNLLASTSGKLITELQLFLSRINVLQSVFSVGDQTKLKCSLPEHSTEEKPSFKLLMDLLGESIAGAKSLQTQALDVLKEVASMNMEDEKQEAVNRTRTFEVMIQGLTAYCIKSKLFISVNYVDGKISFLKNASEALDVNNTADQSKVVQLVKSRDNNKKLRLKIESKPSKDLEFDDGKSREIFCQLVQQMKNKHSENNLRKEASVFIGTWNMGNANPQGDLRPWFKCQGQGKTMDSSLAQIPFDIYAIGTQECPFGDKEWTVKIKDQLKRMFPKEEFFMVGVSSLWSIRLVIFANQALKHMISHIHQSNVRTGIANALGNKGGVGISFSLGQVSLCFVNCHLAARGTPARVLRRNQNYLDILNGLNLGQRGVFGITHQFHHVFWFGDLNYRIDLDVEEVLGGVKCLSFGKMKNHDQLRVERQKENVFIGFDEDSISFPPTYRYKRGSNEYITQKAKRSGVLTNVPSWCDRVLRHSFPETKISCTSYGCTEFIRSSDHWPVFCTFNVSLPFSASPAILKNPVSNRCEIVFTSIMAKIKTNSRTQFVVEFHSSCLEEMQKSQKNNVLDSRKKNFVDSSDNRSSGQHSCPEWSKAVIPTLYPMMSEHDYLSEQHLLLAIKSVDNDESYGECCIALKTMINVFPQKSEAVLSHLGEKTGQIKFEMHVKLPESNNNETPSQSRDLISVGDLDDPPVIGKGTSNTQRPKSAVPHKVTPPLPERPTNPGHSVGYAPPVPKRHSVPMVKEPMAPNLPPLPEKRSKPRTVQELMQKIGFQKYTQRLLENGFDEFDFLADLDEQVLSEIGVPKEHRGLILEAIKRYVT